MSDIVERLLADGDKPSQREARILLWEELKDAADEIKRLREALDQIADLFSLAVQDDCENGVKWLNERAAADYLKEYPETRKAIHETHVIISAALGEDR
jgi:hypothetical protein